MAISGSLYPKATRLYPRGYVFQDIVFLSSGIKQKATITKPRFPPTLNLKTLVLSTSTILSFSQQLIYHTSGSLYPKATRLYPRGYVFQRNIFTAESLLSQQILSSISFDITFNFISADIKTKTDVFGPELRITYIFHSQDHHVRSGTTFPIFYTNPTVFHAHGASPRIKTNVGISKLPDWYKPHKNKVGRGVWFSAGKPQTLFIRLKNVQADRLEIKKTCPTEEHRIQDVESSLRWIEKRIVDYHNTLLEKKFELALDKRDFLPIPTTISIDKVLETNIGKLVNINESLSLPIQFPEAKDVVENGVWSKANRDDRRLFIAIPTGEATDRYELIPWGGEFFQICKRRYKPPIDLNFTFSKKITARIENIPKQKLYGSLYPRSSKLRPAIRRMDFSEYLFTEHRKAVL